MRNWIIMGIILLMLTACEKKIEEVMVDPIEEVTEEQVQVQEQEAKPVFSRGLIIDDIYTNDFFDIRYELPVEWLVLTLDEVDAIMNLGENILESENMDLADTLETPEVYSLMGVFKYSMGQKVSVNPSMIISAEKLGPNTDMKNAQEYLEKSKEILVSTGIPYIVDHEVRMMTMDGQDYGVLDVTIDTGETIIGQSHYALYSNGYVVNILMTYSEEDGMYELKSVLGE